MFGRKKPRAKPDFDKTGKRPVIRASICTGEQVAGFKDVETGQFQEVMLIQDDGDFREFLRLYDLEETEVGREW